MVAEPKPGLVSVEAYFRLEEQAPDRHEYVDGEVYALAGGTRHHALPAVAVADTLRNALSGRSCRTFSSDVRAALSESRYVYPDVTVSCDPADFGEGDSVSHPLVVMEILSPTTERYDRGEKFALYRDCSSIQDYVLFAVDSPRIEVYHRQQEAWLLRAYAPGSEVWIPSLDITFAMDDIYADLEPVPPHVEATPPD